MFIFFMLVFFIIISNNPIAQFSKVFGLKISAVGDIPCNEKGERVIEQISNESTEMQIWLGDFGYLDGKESVSCFSDLLVKYNWV